MFVRHPLKPMLIGFALLVGSAAMTAAPAASPSSPDAGTARVWFLRPSSFSNPEIAGAAPIVYANGAPLAAIPPSSAFYRDFAPGNYNFTTQPYGIRIGHGDTVELAPGSQTYLEVQWVSGWEEGDASGGPGDLSHGFTILNLPAELAQGYLPTLSYLGQNELQSRAAD